MGRPGVGHRRPRAAGREAQARARRCRPRDPLEAVPDRPAQHLPHVRLADRVARIGFCGADVQDPDGLGKGIRRRTGVPEGGPRRRLGIRCTVFTGARRVPGSAAAPDRGSADGRRPTTTDLVIAAAGAGALGFLAAGYKTAAAMSAEIAAVRSATAEPFGVNVFVPGTPYPMPGRWPGTWIRSAWPSPTLAGTTTASTTRSPPCWRPARGHQLHLRLPRGRDGPRLAGRGQCGGRHSDHPG